MCRAAAGCTKLRDAAIDPHRQSGRGAARARSAGAPPLDGMLGEATASRVAQPVARKSAMTSAAIAAQRLGGGRTAAAALAGGRRRAEPGVVSRLRSRFPKVRPLKLLTTSIFSVALVGIVANAMVFQRGRHPAPLFGVGQSGDGQGEAPPRAASAAPAPAPAERTGSVPPPPVAPVAEPTAPVAAPAARPAPVHRAARPHQEDRAATLPGTKQPTPTAEARHPRPGHAIKPGAPDAKLAAHGDAKPRTAAASAPADRHGASEAAAILAHPAPTHPAAAHPAAAHAVAADAATADGAAKHHPRPHAAKPEAAKTQTAPQKAAATE